MGFIKLKKLIATGPNAEPSEIKFGNKLTIIAGPSDTGKSCIYKCVDYVLGAINDDDHAPFDESDGFDTITLIIGTQYGDITLTRVQGTTKTTVSCDNPEIESGEYVLKEGKKNNKTIDKLMLKILGLKDDLKVPSNVDGDPESFSWRMIKKTFLIDENRADKPISILRQPHGETSYIAALIYFLTGNTLDEYLKKDEPDEIKTAKRNAVIAYISEHRMAMSKKKEVLEEKIKQSGIDITSLETIIQELNESLIKLNDEIERLIAENTTTSFNLMTLQKKQQKNELIFSKYEELKSDYQKEINRLTFIVNNEVSIGHKTAKSICPYCDHEMTPKNPTSYIEAAKVELRNVVNNLNELDETSAMLKDTLDDDGDLIAVYKETIEANKTKINDVLAPKRTELAKKIQSYEEYIRLKSAIDELGATDGDLEEDLKKYQKGNDVPKLKFEAKKLLFSVIGQYIIDNGVQIFTEVKYPSINTIDFTENKLDLKVNNKNKIRRGKGYRAFTNSMLILLLRKFIEEKSAHKGCFWFLDSPLKGLSVPEDKDDDSDNVRKGFFDYLINLETADQIVVIENTKYSELPELEINDDVVIYKFTQKENNGRYGFLKNVRKA